MENPNIFAQGYCEKAKDQALGRAGTQIAARIFDAAIALWVGIEYHTVMTIRPIIIHPDPRLKKTAAPVAEVTPAIEHLAEDMLETMYDAPGIGLAAPQIGVMSRVFVMDCVKEEGAAPAPMVLMNPVITWVSEELSTYEEGCLSIPEQYGEVERPAEIDMQWLGLDGKTHTQRFDGLWATCAQHELDHLNGKLFIDYFKPMRRQLITRKMQKFKREQARS